MENLKLKNIEAIAFLTLISVNSIILSTCQELIRTCSSASLINVLLITICATIFVVIFCLLAKSFSGNGLLEISNFLGGKILKFIVGTIFIAYFTFRASMFLKKICDCLQIIYYPMTNVVFIALLFCITTGIVLFFKNNSLFKVSVLILPTILITTILVFIGNGKNFNFENIFPILGNSINSTFFSGLSNIYAFYRFSLPAFHTKQAAKP